MISKVMMNLESIRRLSKTIKSHSIMVVQFNT
jgi:hypothetical protein